MAGITVGELTMTGLSDQNLSPGGRAEIHEPVNGDEPVVLVSATYGRQGQIVGTLQDFSDEATAKGYLYTTQDIDITGGYSGLFVIVGVTLKEFAVRDEVWVEATFDVIETAGSS